MKFRTKKNKTTAKASSVPAIYFTQRSARMLKQFTDGLSQRVIEGRAFFIIELDGILRSAVQRNAPQIKVGDEMVDYAPDLRLAVVDGVEDMDAVCIFHNGMEKKMSTEDLKNMALFIRPHMGSPEWTRVLAMYGPWPGYLVPVDVTNKDARIISRTARPDELQALEKRIMERKDEIVDALNRAGAQNISLKPSGRLAGTKVNEDLGFAVLRAEMGMGEVAGKAHWRPAIRETVNAVPKVLSKYLRYIRTGDNLFDLPGDADSAINRTRAEELATSGHFMRELAPFIPRG